MRGREREEVEEREKRERRGIGEREGRKRRERGERERERRAGICRENMTLKSPFPRETKNVGFSLSVCLR